MKSALINSVLSETLTSEYYADLKGKQICLQILHHALFIFPQESKGDGAI